MMSSEPITVVNIISVSYSGSTWANLLLGSHSEAFSIGEVKRILYEEKAMCTLHGEECPVWPQFDVQSEVNPFLQVARITGKRYLVVNNSRKFLPPQRHPQIKPVFIHLMRDGRAVTASMLRKGVQQSIWSAAKLWRHDVKRNERLLRRQPKEDVLEVIYERLKDDTPGELKRICEFIGLDFEPGMVNFWETDHHFIGGNRGTLLSMCQKTDDKAEKQVVEHAQEDRYNWDLDHYRKTDPANFRDQRWAKELSNGQLRVFGLIAGRLNRKYGYPPSLQRD